MIGVMLNVIAMMIAGYLLAEHKGLTKDARAGLSIYIGFCALPALFFASLAKEAALLLSQEQVAGRPRDASSVASHLFQLGFGIRF